MRSADQDKLRLVSAMNRQREKIKDGRAAKVVVAQEKQAERVEQISTQVVTFRRSLRFTVGSRRHMAAHVLKQVIVKK